MKSKETKNLSSEMSQPEPERGTGGADKNKRRLLKGLATSAPVVMAVSSKPALANFCTVSGFLSGNLSNHNEDKHCGGMSPGLWKNNYGRYFDEQTFRRTKFKDEFGVLWYGDNAGHWHDDVTFLEVLNFQGEEDRYKFGFHAIAAYCNALKIPGYGLEADNPTTGTGVVQMVQDIVTNGYYEHSATGKTLDAAEFVRFIEQTYH